MTTILLLVATGITYGFWLGIPILTAYIALKVGRLVDGKDGAFIFQWIVPVVVIGVPAVWTFAGYMTFQTECKNVPSPSFKFFPESQPDSFYLDQSGIKQSPYHRSSSIYKQLTFWFYEEGYRGGDGPRGTGFQYLRRTYSDGQRQYWDGRIEYVPEPLSKYAFVLSRPNRIDYWWRPPIYISESIVIERSSNKELAKASDLIFGGGIIGIYFSIIKNSVEYSYLSCGFASEDIGTWRPKNGRDPRRNQYLQADLNFLSTALGPSLQEGAVHSTK